MVKLGGKLQIGIFAVVVVIGIYSIIAWKKGWFPYTAANKKKLSSLLKGGYTAPAPAPALPAPTPDASSDTGQDLALPDAGTGPVKLQSQNLQGDPTVKPDPTIESTFQQELYKQLFLPYDQYPYLYGQNYKQGLINQDTNPLNPLASTFAFRPPIMGGDVPPGALDRGPASQDTTLDTIDRLYGLYPPGGGPAPPADSTFFDPNNLDSSSASLQDSVTNAVAGTTPAPTPGSAPLPDQFAPYIDPVTGDTIYPQNSLEADVFSPLPPSTPAPTPTPTPSDCPTGQHFSGCTCNCVNDDSIEPECFRDCTQCAEGQKWNWCTKSCVPAASLIADCPPPRGEGDGHDHGHHYGWGHGRGHHFGHDGEDGEDGGGFGFPGIFGGGGINIQVGDIDGMLGGLGIDIQGLVRGVLSSSGIHPDYEPSVDHSELSQCIISCNADTGCMKSCVDNFKSGIMAKLNINGMGGDNAGANVNVNTNTNTQDQTSGGFDIGNISGIGSIGNLQNYINSQMGQANINNITSWKGLNAGEWAHAAYSGNKRNIEGAVIAARREEIEKNRKRWNMSKARISTRKMLKEKPYRPSAAGVRSLYSDGLSIA